MQRRLALVARGLGLLMFLAGPARAEILYYRPAPEGTLGIARPRLGIRVDATDGDAVEKATITVDGVAYEAQTDGNFYYHQPSAPLAPGVHNARVQVAFGPHYQPLDQSWSFTVAPGAIASFPPAGGAQLAALGEVNRYRRLADLAPVTLDPALTAATEAHAHYYLLNPSAGLSVHDQRPGAAGFIGAKPWDRGRYFGFDAAGTYMEDMHFVADQRQAVQGWVDSVYHRFLITDPNLDTVGFGYGADGAGAYVNVLDGSAHPGDAKQVQVVAYPIAGQQKVPVRWDGLETPDPLANFPGGRAAGYPITLQFSGSGVSSANVQTASLTDSAGNRVPIWVDTPVIDSHLRTELALLPKSDLQPATRYTASVSGTLSFQDGFSRGFSRTWWFTTDGARDQVSADAGIKVLLNGLPVRFDVPLALKNNRTMVPMRAIFETLGAGVAWDPDRYDIRANYLIHAIALKIGNDRAVVDGQDVYLDAAPEIIGNHTLVPLRFVAETLGLTVNWDPATRTVRLATILGL